MCLGVQATDKAGSLSDLATDLLGAGSASCDSWPVRTSSVTDACSAADRRLLAQSSWMPGVGLSPTAFSDARAAAAVGAGKGEQKQLLAIARAAVLAAKGWMFNSSRARNVMTGEEHAQPENCLRSQDTAEKSRCLRSNNRPAWCNKATLLTALRAVGVPVPLSTNPVALHPFVGNHSADEALLHALGRLRLEAGGVKYPVALKYGHRSQGKGVYLNIPNDSRLAAALREFNERQVPTDDLFHLEQMVPATRHYRVHVINREPFMVSLRCPLAVTGNGIDSLRKLLGRYKRERKHIGWVEKPLRVLNAEPERIRQHGGWSAVPAKGERITLGSKPNIHQGGTMRYVPPGAASVRELVRRVLSVMPADQRQIGIDLMADASTRSAVLNEVNRGCVGAEISFGAAGTPGCPLDIIKTLLKVDGWAV